MYCVFDAFLFKKKKKLVKNMYVNKFYNNYFPSAFFGGN